MEEKKIKFNHVKLIGKVESNLKLDYVTRGIFFYTFNLAVKRRGPNIDIIPILISEKFSTSLSEIKVGKKICIIGQVQVISTKEKNNRFIVVVSVKEFSIVSEEKKDVNQVDLECFICKEVFYKKTQNGEDFADVRVRTKSCNYKTYYTSCSAWGQKARLISLLPVETRIKIYGRIQSKEYYKKISDDQVEKRIDCYISIQNFEVIE